MRTARAAQASAADVLAVLEGIEEEAREAKRAAAARLWRSVAWPSPATEGDAFHAVLRQLARKRRYFKTSAATWWL